MYGFSAKSNSRPLNILGLLMSLCDVIKAHQIRLEQSLETPRDLITSSSHAVSNVVQILGKQAYSRLQNYISQVL